jgi:hypothetical protein
MYSERLGIYGNFPNQSKDGAPPGDHSDLIADRLGWDMSRAFGNRLT